MAGVKLCLLDKRGPDSERAPGFASRRGQHQRASGGELDVQSGVEIVVE